MCQQQMTNIQILNAIRHDKIITIQFLLEAIHYTQGYFAGYKKWLRYYLDFYDMYSIPDDKSERDPPVYGKAGEKTRREQALDHDEICRYHDVRVDLHSNFH